MTFAEFAEGRDFVVLKILYPQDGRENYLPYGDHRVHKFDQAEAYWDEFDGVVIAAEDGEKWSWSGYTQPGSAADASVPLELTAGCDEALWHKVVAAGGTFRP